MTRWRRVAASAGVVLAIGFLSAGCTSSGGEPTAKPSPSPSRTAVFASNAEATAAAKALYEKYLLIGQQVSEDGGRGVERFKPIVAPEEYSSELASAQNQQARKLKAVGPTKLRKFRLQRADLVKGSATAYACIDITDVRVISTEGKDVTPAGSPNEQTFLPSFVWRGNHLILEKNATWSGESIC